MIHHDPFPSVCYPLHIKIGVDIPIASRWWA